MTESKIILITPGLVTAEIAFYSGTPTIFLPASNNSQCLQIEEYRRHLAPASVQLSDFMPRLQLDKLPARETMRAVLSQLRRFEKSSEIQLKVGNKINRLIADQPRWEKQFVTGGRKFIEKQGGNGVEIAADKINDFISSKTNKSRQ